MKFLLKYKNIGIIVISLLIIVFAISAIYSSLNKSDTDKQAADGNKTADVIKPTDKPNLNNDNNAGGKKDDNGQNSSTQTGDKTPTGTTDSSQNVGQNLGIDDKTLTSQLKKEKNVLSARVYVYEGTAIGAIVLKKGTSKSSATDLVTRYADKIKANYKDLKVNVQAVCNGVNLSTKTLE